jgi:hypothetical protein
MEQKFKELREKLQKIGVQSSSFQEFIDCLTSKYDEQLSDMEKRLAQLEDKAQNSTHNEKIALCNQQVNICNNNVVSIQDLISDMVIKIDQIQSEALGNGVRLSILEKTLNDKKEKEEAKTKSLRPTTSTSVNDNLKQRTLSLSKINKLNK